jgi:hypothetical protein
MKFICDFNPSMGGQGRGVINCRPDWAAEEVPDQAGLYNENLLKK